MVQVPVDRLGVVGHVMSFLDRYPEDGVLRLETFMSTPQKLLWTTEDLVNLTGWSESTIQKLRAKGKLPYIPTTPCAYVPWEVKRVLEKLQVGGNYGKPIRRRRKRKAAVDDKKIAGNCDADRSRRPA